MLIKQADLLQILNDLHSRKQAKFAGNRQLFRR